MSIIPTPGRIVLYTLSESDAEAINRRRKDFGEYRKAAGPDSGHVAHVGNDVRAGDVYPAIIVRAWGATAQSQVNLQVLLDGNDTFWATSRAQGAGENEWHEPPQA